MGALHADPTADAAFAKTKLCMGCHAIDKKVVGPAFKDVARKYQGSQSDANTVDRLATKVIKGGNGVWGVTYMPANERLSPEEAKRLVRWVLSIQ